MWPGCTRAWDEEDLMIEINLSQQRKEKSLTKVAGIDFSQINVKGFLIAIVILYIPEMFLVSHFESKNEELNITLQGLRTEERRLQSQVQGLENIEKQINALKDQEEKLAEKLNVVQEIINKKQNPFDILKYIADNTPDDVWINELTISPSLEIVIKGQSRSWRSIGIFLDNLKNSIFFAKDIAYTQPGNTNNTTEDGARFETYEIKTKIVRFE